MAINKRDIKLYLTSALPEIEQTMSAQSIGAYPATVEGSPEKSLVSPESHFSSSVRRFEEKIEVNDYSDIKNNKYISSNGEIMEAESINSDEIDILKRNINEVSSSHKSNDRLHGLSFSMLFDNRFNQYLQQYRCIAIKNNSNSETMYKVGIDFSQNSRNVSSFIKMAIEEPTNDFISGTVDSGTRMSLSDNNLINQFVNNEIVNSVVKIISGNKNDNNYRLISSYDADEGTIVFDSSWPEKIKSGDLYNIEPAPAQRVTSGINSPIVDGDKITNFVLADVSGALDINVSGERSHGRDMQPGDVIYLWLQRNLHKSGFSFDLNNLNLRISFQKST